MQSVAQQLLPADPSAPAAARRLVRSALREWRLEALLDPVQLLTSELVTNALLHARSAPRLTVARTPDGVLVTVEDGSPSGPARRRHGAQATTGRGVALLEDLADEWGWERQPGGKAVWFRASARHDRWAALADADGALASP